MDRQRILLIEDDPDGCRSVTEAIEDARYTVTPVMAGLPGVEAFREGGYDAVLSDLVLPDIDGLEVLRRLKEIDGTVPVMIMTAYGTVSTAVQALKEGAYDYITKPLDLDELQAKVARAVEAHQLRTDVVQLESVVTGQYGAAAMVAESPSMKDVLRRLESLSDTDATVLIEGESGTGKELVARALHVEGQRRRGAFVAVNCGAFAEGVLESELFGHEKGAFTGADRQRMGAFERANGGTLFLDEIGDAPKSVQVKLLRVLEERELVRVGGQEGLKVDVRLISATNRDLAELVNHGEFREDLLYRLKVVGLRIPPLRERIEDIRPLVDRFVREIAVEHGRRVDGVEEGCYTRLENQDWPGNVRQLRNVIESAVVMAGSSQLTADDLDISVASRPTDAGLSIPDDMTLDELEREILSQLLQRNEGNRTLVAEKLGLSRRTIQRKIKDYRLPF